MCLVSIDRAQSREETAGSRRRQERGGDALSIRGSDGGSTVNQCSRTTLVRPVLGSSQRLAGRGLAGAHRFQRIDPCACPANTRGRRSTQRDGANRKAGQPAHGLARGFIYDEERGHSPLVRARCASPSILPGARTSIPFLSFPVLLGSSRPWFLCTFPLFSDSYIWCTCRPSQLAQLTSVSVSGSDCVRHGFLLSNQLSVAQRLFPRKDTCIP